MRWPQGKTTHGAAGLTTVAQLPQQLASTLEPLIDSRRLMVLVIMLIVLAVGMVMDLSATLLILVPLFIPVVKLAAIDPVCFGLMFVLNCSIGIPTPIVGAVLNVVCGVGKVQMSEAVRGVLPFIFPTRDVAYTVLDYPENGYRNMTNNRGPIKAPADVSGSTCGSLTPRR